MVTSCLRGITLKDFNPIKHWADPLTSTSDKMKNLAKNFLIFPVAKEFLLLKSLKNGIQITSAAIKAPWMDPESRSNSYKNNWPHAEQAVLSAFGFTLLYLGDRIDFDYNFDSGYTINSIINKVYSILDESTTKVLTDDNILNSYSLFFIGAATYALGAYLLYYPSSSLFHWNAGPPQSTAQGQAPPPPPPGDKTGSTPPQPQQRRSQQPSSQQRQTLNQQRQPPTVEEFNREIFQVLQSRRLKQEQKRIQQKQLQQQAGSRGPLPQTRNSGQQQKHQQSSGRGPLPLTPKEIAGIEMLEALRSLEETEKLDQVPNLSEDALKEYTDLKKMLDEGVDQAQFDPETNVTSLADRANSESKEEKERLRAEVKEEAENRRMTGYRKTIQGFFDED